MAYSPTQLPELLTCVTRIFLALEHYISPLKNKRIAVIACYIDVLHVSCVDIGGGGRGMGEGVSKQRKSRITSYLRCSAHAHIGTAHARRLRDTH